MSFQFQCPQGHLLEGDESQAGQQCQCPTCGMLFIIPQPIAAPVAAAGEGQGGFGFGGGNGGGSAAVAAASEPELLHIPCPNGHELETPVEMLEQDVLCPQCQAQFKLRRKNSVEYKRKKELQESIRLEKSGNLWLNVAITAVVLVVLGLVGLIAMSQMSQPTAPPTSAAPK